MSVNGFSLGLWKQAIGFFALCELHKHRIAVRTVRERIPFVVFGRWTRFDGLTACWAGKCDHLNALGFEAVVVLSVTLHQGSGWHHMIPLFTWTPERYPFTDFAPVF